MLLLLGVEVVEGGVVVVEVLMEVGVVVMEVLMEVVEVLMEVVEVLVEVVEVLVGVVAEVVEVVQVEVVVEPEAGVGSDRVTRIKIPCLPEDGAVGVYKMRIPNTAELGKGQLGAEVRGYETRSETDDGLGGGMCGVRYILGGCARMWGGHCCNL